MTSTSSPDPTFQALLTAAQLDSAAIASYLQGFAEQRRWMMPPTGDGNDAWSGDLTDLEGIGKAFNRAAANEAYTEALNNGTSGACAAQNIQIAYVAMMERAFRARHKTPCRSIAHAAARRQGHGNPGGIHIGQILQFVQDLLGGSQQK